MLSLAEAIAFPGLRPDEEAPDRAYVGLDGFGASVEGIRLALPQLVYAGWQLRRACFGSYRAPL